MPRPITDLGASVRARLQNLSRQSGQSFELMLTRYALERLLFRLGSSVHAERFVLKGAMLLTRLIRRTAPRNARSGSPGIRRPRSGRDGFHLQGNHLPFGKIQHDAGTSLGLNRRCHQ
jgi:hypothetical protein